VADLTLPTFVAAGTVDAGAASCAPGIPAGSQLNDIMYLLVTTKRHSTWEATVPADWTAIGTPQAIGTVDGSASVQFQSYWKRHTGSESAPSCTVTTSDYILARIISIRGAPNNGVPHEDVIQTTGTATTSVDFNTNFLTGPKRLMLGFIAGTRDATATNTYSAWSYGSNGATECIDNSTATGDGGSIGAAYSSDVDFAMAATSWFNVTQLSTAWTATSFGVMPRVDNLLPPVIVPPMRAPGYSNR
jgi:hypothetical protein